MSQPVALITGASRGIGRATAVALTQAGYRLALVARGRTDLEESARLAGATDALVVPADVTDPAQVRAVIHETVTRFGRLDAVVNVAGVAPVRRIEEMSADEWHAVINVNLSAVFYVIKYAWPHLRVCAKAAQDRHAVIVNVSSLASRDPFPGFAAYGAAKAGLNILDLVAAREGEADGIAVHTIAPGAVETAMFRQLMTPEQYPKEKTLKPEEVADVIVQCVTGRLRHTRGEVIYLHKTL
jgi:NAD(P)-dependent dehydrogenase (short-subunit alcohol dehydrogenase family)